MHQSQQGNNKSQLANKLRFLITQFIPQNPHQLGLVFGQIFWQFVRMEKELGLLCG
jgi:hypothetical protein